MLSYLYFVFYIIITLLYGIELGLLSHQQHLRIIILVIAIIILTSRQLKEMNSLAHHRNVKQLNSMIDSYQKKLDDKINQMFNFMINLPKNINDVTLPIIENKKIGNHLNTKDRQFIISKRSKNRTQSIGSKSFVINQDLSNSQQFSQADYLFQTFKNRSQKQQNSKRNDINSIVPTLGRAIGSQTYAKPKIVKRKPQILSKQMRWDPFYEKNAIKAQQLNQGMLSLVQKGKVSKNVDIITAFEKGRPILETHQAIFHHVQQKFTNSDLNQSQISPNKSTIRKQVHSGQPANPQKSKNAIKNHSLDDEPVNYQSNTNHSGWALTMPEDHNRTIEQRQSKSNFHSLLDERLQIYSLYFLHYKLVKDETFAKMKKERAFYQNWGQIMQIIGEIQKQLKKYNIQVIYFNGNKILQLSKKRQSLTKIKIKDLSECLIKITSKINGKQTKINPFSIKSIVNKDSKVSFATSIIISAFTYKIIRQKYMGILRRKKYQNKVREWLRNGFIIKQYRKELERYREQILRKFQQQQNVFTANLPSIQQKKHFQIHIVNRKFMNKFNYFQQYCNTQITRIFNLQNVNTNIIYVSPFQLNVDTINYYFKIMELEEIQNYNERVTFLQLDDITSRVRLPESLNTSQKLYFSSKALRKLKRKIQGTPAYFVTSYPSEIDIRLSVFLQIPIYSGNFQRINSLRSSLTTEPYHFSSLAMFPSMGISPKSHNPFELSNMLIRYCEGNKKYRKYIIKINGFHSSSGLALLTYPFSSLPEMYTNTALVQPYYFRSIEKFYIELAKSGGIVQPYEQSIRTIVVCAKIINPDDFNIIGTFQRISVGFVNIGYLFPQKCVPHKVVVDKSKQVFSRMAAKGHIGYIQITLVVTIEDDLYLQQIQLYSTRITNSLFYFKFLAGGYLNHLGQFMTKITGEPQIGDSQDESIATMQSRSYCYIPFILHFGLTEKQTSSFFQLCRIGGISFDLQNKFGTTFIILGSLKDTVGIITTAKDRKSMVKLVSKATQFLIKQNSHNVSVEMLKQKQERMRDRLNVNSIKERLQQI